MPSIFDYKHFFDDYCKECSLDLRLSFDMPSDYETACGTFDPASKTVFINAEHLNAKPDYEKAFFLRMMVQTASVLIPKSTLQMICSFTGVLVSVTSSL